MGSLYKSIHANLVDPAYVHIYILCFPGLESNALDYFAFFIVFPEFNNKILFHIAIKKYGCFKLVELVFRLQVKVKV